MAVLQSKQLVGLPVVSIAEGKRLGTVRDVMVDATERRMVGFTVQPDGRGRDTQVLLADDIRAVGPDAVTVADRDRLRPLAALPELRAMLEQQMPIKGKAVFTSEGKRLGQVDEFTLDTQSYTIDAYFVSAPGLGGLIAGAPRRIPGDWVVSSGPDALVIRGDEEERHSRSA